MRVYIDSDILIWHLRGRKRAYSFLKKMNVSADYELWIGAMQRAEIVFFMRPGEEELTKLFLSQFKTSPVDQQIVDAAGFLYRKWNPSHGIDINDAFLAATVLLNGGHLYTLNLKHFPMDEINAQRPW